MAVINHSINQSYISAVVLNLGSTSESPGGLLKAPVPRPCPGPIKAESLRVSLGMSVLQQQGDSHVEGASVRNVLRGTGHRSFRPIY